MPFLLNMSIELAVNAEICQIALPKLHLWKYKKKINW